MKILLTGQTGQLGYVLAKDLQVLGDVVSPSRAQMDLTQTEQMRDMVRREQPNLIINAAAYTAVDQAESEIALVTAMNAEVPRILAQEAQRLGAGIVQFSTDYVFDGSHALPYREEHPTAPVNVYGKTKLEGEHAIVDNCDAFWIFRTSWLYGAHGGNFLKTIVRLAQECDHLTVVADQVGAPTWTRTISRVLCELLRRRPAHMTVADYMRPTAAIYHLTANGATTRHAYAQQIVRCLHRSRASCTLHPEAIAAVSTSAYPTPARRPANSCLQTDKLKQTFNIVLPDWEDAMHQCLSEL